MKYLSLFTGIGGFELGIKRATDDKWECIGISEIDKYATQIFNKHFKGVKNYGDATKIDTKQLPNFELLVGGFPCQAFSVAGKRRGFNDTRGTLFFEIARILRDKRPRYFLLENVKGLLSHEDGKTFQTMLRVLADLGYRVEWQVLNSKNFGVPQNRERVFIIGHLRGECERKIFPIEKTTETFLEYIGGIEGERKKWLDDGKDNSRNFSQGQRVYSTNGIASTLAGNAGGLGGKTGLYAMRGRGENNKQVLEKRKDIYANTVTSVQKDNLWSDGIRIRRLTPVECERLQGFPEMEKYSIIEVWQKGIKNLDISKTNVSVETGNGKRASHAGNVGKTRKQVNVKSAEQSSNTKHQRTNKPVLADVLISYGQKGIRIYSRKKLIWSASNVEKSRRFHQPIPTEDFVRLLAGINTIQGKEVPLGKAVLHPSGQCLTLHENGKKPVRLSGKEIMQLAEIAEKDLTTLKKLLKSITSDPSDIKNSERKLTTLSSFVIHAITGCIPTEILNQNIFTVKISNRYGWTQKGIDKDGNEVEISDTQRYKCLGNAVTVNVIEFIIRKLGSVK